VSRGTVTSVENACLHETGRISEHSRMTARSAVGVTLVLGGGFAGAYVARLLGKRGATIVSPQSLGHPGGLKG